MSAPTDEVLLRIPAQPEYGRIVRVGGAALGIRQGLSFAEIDELRLAIDEAVILLLDGSDADDDTELVTTFRFDDGRLAEARLQRYRELLASLAASPARS